MFCLKKSGAREFPAQKISRQNILVGENPAKKFMIKKICKPKNPIRKGSTAGISHTIVSCGTGIVSLRTETHFPASRVWISPTVTWIPTCHFHRIRSRFLGLIREKPSLIRIKSPVHRRKIKRLNRPNCGHDDRQERIVVCLTQNNTCFDPKIRIFHRRTLTRILGTGQASV